MKHIIREFLDIFWLAQDTTSLEYLRKYAQASLEVPALCLGKKSLDERDLLIHLKGMVAKIEKDIHDFDRY